MQLQGGDGPAPLQAQAQGPVATFGAGDDVAALPQLLEGQDADGLLAEGAVVARLGRLKQAAGHLPEAVAVHAPAVVLHGDDRVPAPAAEHNADAAARASRLGVLVGGVGDELVEGVLGVLVGLAGDEHSLGQVPDPQSHLLGRHGRGW